MQAAPQSNPSTDQRLGVFLSAEWRNLIMLNYEIDPGLLAAYVPRGTELDLWQGRAFVSLVGFLFLHTRVMGAPIPFHRNFEEINLRFYVRRRGPEGWRRGVVFIKEIVPRWAIAAVARVLYNENYVARPMRHRNERSSFEYRWRETGGWHRIFAETKGDAAYPHPESEVEFITEHYWGYARQRGGGVMEYRVEHPQWKVWAASNAGVEGDVAEVYGRPFVDVLSARPASAFVADGSAILVRKGRRL
jgi:uncharacterized protein